MSEKRKRKNNAKPENVDLILSINLENLGFDHFIDEWCLMAAWSNGVPCYQVERWCKDRATEIYAPINAQCGNLKVSVFQYRLLVWNSARSILDPYIKMATDHMMKGGEAPPYANLQDMPSKNKGKKSGGGK